MRLVGGSGDYGRGPGGSAAVHRQEHGIVWPAVIVHGDQPLVADQPNCAFESVDERVVDLADGERLDRYTARGRVSPEVLRRRVRGLDAHRLRAGIHDPDVDIPRAAGEEGG